MRYIKKAMTAIIGVVIYGFIAEYILGIKDPYFNNGVRAIIPTAIVLISFFSLYNE